MSHIFISYSSRNRDYANKLADKLRQEGFDVWIDQAKIRGGDEWWTEIEKAIIQCSAFIIIMSPESKTSKWVKREIHLAENLDKPTFPYLLNGENWNFYAHIQYEDVRGEKLPNCESFEKLKRHIHTDSHRIEVVHNGALLRFDGCYIFEIRENSYHYLLFDEQKNVTATLLGEYNVDKAQIELHKANPLTTLHSDYTLKNNHLVFTLSVTVASHVADVTRFSGLVRKDAVELNVTNLLRSDISPIQRQYIFVPFNSN